MRQAQAGEDLQGGGVVHQEEMNEVWLYTDQPLRRVGNDGRKTDAVIQTLTNQNSERRTDVSSRPERVAGSRGSAAVPQ